MSFKRLDPEDISISAESVVAPLWITGVPTLTSFHTSSTQVASATGDYYYDVYHQATTETTSRVQFSLAYGNKNGYGTELYNTSIAGKSPSSTVYGQYRSLIFGDEDTDFNFVGTNTSDFIYVINIERSRYKEKLLPGSLNLKLDSGNGVLHLTDNSQDVSTVTFNDAGRVYEIISGSDGTAYDSTGYDSNGASYGKLLPDIGVIILNGTALDQAAPDGLGTGFHTVDADYNDDNPIDNLFSAISTGGSFKFQSEETISSNYVFVRVRNSEFNYSTNPSNITGSGELRHDVMINSPQAYITTVGLYNDSNDLLAIAKLSRPLLKDFTKEALVRIKLDY